MIILFHKDHSSFFLFCFTLVFYNIWRQQYSVPEERQRQILNDMQQLWWLCLHISQTQWDVGPISDEIRGTTL